MAQPPLSQQIRRLEADIDLQLFDRSTRRVALTAAGELILTEARKLLAAATLTERAIEEFRSGATGVLRLGFVDSAAYNVMPELLHEYRTRWPGINYELRSMSSDEQHAALLVGEIDLGICRTATRAAEMRSIEFLLEPLCLAVGANHPLAEAKSTSIGKLVDESFIGFDRRASPTLHAELVGMFNGQGVHYDPIIEATEYATILGLVAGGEGIAVVPASVQALQPPNLRYVQFIDTTAALSMLLMARPDEQLASVNNAFSLVLELFA